MPGLPGFLRVWFCSWFYLIRSVDELFVWFVVASIVIGLGSLQSKVYGGFEQT